MASGLESYLQKRRAHKLRGDALYTHPQRTANWRLPKLRGPTFSGLLKGLSKRRKRPITLAKVNLPE